MYVTIWNILVRKYSELHEKEICVNLCIALSHGLKSLQIYSSYFQHAIIQTKELLEVRKYLTVVVSWFMAPQRWAFMTSCEMESNTFRSLREHNALYFQIQFRIQCDNHLLTSVIVFPLHIWLNFTSHNFSLELREFISVLLNKNHVLTEN